jgi:murein DD-endopeptidase MepM/ murein hydrolase activator NlpD
VRKTVVDAGGEIIWHDGAKGERSMTITTKSGNTVDLKEGTDFYVDENGTAHFYNNVRAILEAQDMAVDFDENTRNISVTTVAGASVMTLVNGEDFYIGPDKRAHFKDGGTLPPGEERPTPAPAPQQQASSGQTGAGTASSTQAPNDYGFIWPVAPSTRITDTFMTRDGHHRGVDFGAAAGAEIYAIADGKVLFVDNSYSSTSGRGAYIYIDHGNGARAVYQHNSENTVSAGQSIKQGDVIGKVGKSGGVRGSTGYHLHFELFIGVPADQYLGRNIPWSETAYELIYAVDPLLYLPQ